MLEANTMLFYIWVREFAFWYPGQGQGPGTNPLWTPRDDCNQVFLFSPIWQSLPFTSMFRTFTFNVINKVRFKSIFSFVSEFHPSQVQDYNHYFNSPLSISECRGGQHISKITGM